MCVTESDTEITGTKGTVYGLNEARVLEGYEAFILWLKHNVSSKVSAGIISAC